MLDNFHRYWQHDRIKQLTDPRNIGLYIFAVLVIATTWSGMRTLQSNFELQKKIARLQQENSVLKLENDTKELSNKYLETDEYLELSARRQFGKAAPGEKLLIVPKDVALKYVTNTTATTAATKSSVVEKAWYQQNLDDWRDFLAGHGLAPR